MRRNFILFTLCISTICSANTTAIGNDFINLIGQSVANPMLAKLVTDIEFGQHNASFDRNTNIYELNAYDRGITLFFNQNFILSSIHFYDSGYLYKKFKGELPLNLQLQMNQSYFEERFSNFIPDSLNPFIYNGSFVNGDAKVYFKAKHVELIKIIGNPSYIASRDKEEASNWGMRVIPDGKCAKGNCFTGFGRMEWPTSLVYEGNWEYGISHKDGQLFDSMGFNYTGGFKLGFLWGEGRISVPNQYTYKGQFLFGKKHGKGEIRYANGSHYNGEWIADLMEGKGHYYFSANYHYQGDFKNNQFNGQGILHTPDGYIQCGFKDGKPHGKGKQEATKTQSTLSGTWVNGKKEGTFDAYSPLLGNYQVIFENDIEIRKMRQP